ncbi:hypothetical protein QTH11_14545 [Clostridium perfringens]|nr:hypothetical protein [Clostridium perfringens]MDM0467653.1 hypothetical protein [Clostridium perfringens]MDU6144628.1 hypothetical protein [Clostridium perfringens]
MMRKYESIFENLTDSQFEDILKDCGFTFEKTNGEGGLFIGGERIPSYKLKEEYEDFKNVIIEDFYKKTYTKNSVACNTIEGFYNSFDTLEEYKLIA